MQSLLEASLAGGFNPPAGYKEEFLFRFNRSEIQFTPNFGPESVSDDLVCCQKPYFRASIERVRKESSGTLLGEVVSLMEKAVTGKKDYVYVNAKSQYMRAGQLPSFPFDWHCDGAVRLDPSVTALNFQTYDMFNRDRAPDGPRFLTFHTGEHEVSCTEFMTSPLALKVPRLLRSWSHIKEPLEREIATNNPVTRLQVRGELAVWDAYQLHRVRPATRDGWRLWVMLVETSRPQNLTFADENELSNSEINAVYE